MTPLLSPSYRQREYLPLLICTIFLVSFPIAHFHKRSIRYAPSRPARVAYFIQISSSNVALLPRLLRALYDSDNVYALHFDRKIPERIANQALFGLIRELSGRYGYGVGRNVGNVVIVRSEVVTYRGMSMALNYFTGMSKLLKVDKEWDFFINLSGADYPTASQTIVKELLGEALGKEFVEWKPRGTWRGFVEKRLGLFYVDTGLGKMGDGDGDGDGDGEYIEVEENENVMVKGLDFVLAKSSGWMILSRGFCEFLERSGRVRRLIALMGYSDASDEHLVASVLWNGWYQEGDADEDEDEDDKHTHTVVGGNLRSIFFLAPNGSFAMGPHGKRSRQHPFWVDERGQDEGWLFWKGLWEKPAFFTRKIRGLAGFREKIDREMIGVGEGSQQKHVRARRRAYKQRLKNAFREMTRSAQ